MSKTPQIVYIVSSYAAVTHTFIRSEVIALTRLSIPIIVFSIHGQGFNHSPSKSHPRVDVRSVFPLRIAPFLKAHVSFLLFRTKAYSRCGRLLIGAPCRNVNDRIRAIFHFAEAVYVAAQLRNDRPCHIHAHFASGPATVAMGVSCLLGVTWSFTVHRGGLFSEYKPALVRKINNAEFVVAISKFNKDFLAAIDASYATKTHVNYCGIDTDRFSPAVPGKSVRPHQQMVILSVGSLLRRKGYNYLLSALHRLLVEGFDFRSVIVGDGPERQSLQRMICDLSLIRHVRLVGSVDNAELHIYHEMADIFVQSSVSEGIPVALMEAMAAGIPAIATNISGIPELIEDGRTGLLIEPRDIEGLCRMLKTLITDSIVRQELADNGRTHVVERFNQMRNAEFLKRLFEDRLKVWARHETEDTPTVW